MSHNAPYPTIPSTENPTVLALQTLPSARVQHAQRHRRPFIPTWIFGTMLVTGSVMTVGYLFMQAMR